MWTPLLIQPIRHFTELRQRGRIVCAWQKLELPMVNFRSKLLGILLALGILILSRIPVVGIFILHLPLFFISPLRSSWPAGALSFLMACSMGMIFGKWGLGYYRDSWVWPEIVVFWVLFLLPDYLSQSEKKSNSKLEEKYEMEKI